MLSILRKQSSHSRELSNLCKIRCSAGSMNSCHTASDLTGTISSSRSDESTSGDANTKSEFVGSENVAHVQNTTSELISNKRPQFGTRYFKEGDNVFTYNAWDHVEWDEEHLEEARKVVSRQLEAKMNETEFEKIENEADKLWDKFYDIHNDKFYKDRHWLFTEFPELAFNSANDESAEVPRVIFEVGAGVGNTVFPILLQNTNPNLHVYCCDFSETAINILKENEAYDERCTAFVCDLTNDDWNFPFATGSVDLILMIYVLSSIRPDRMKLLLRKLLNYLKPNGKILFRDYGRYDLSQLRFKGSRCVSENFYVRGEGTFVYFFDKDEVAEMFRECGYEIEQNMCEKRLQVNRRKQLKMYRVWIQGKFVKPSQTLDEKASIS